PELAAERRHLDDWLAAPPDKILALVAEMDDPVAAQAGTGPTVYTCPMHPEVTSDQPQRCPKCGMKLLAAGPVTPPAAGHMSHDHGGHESGTHGMEHTQHHDGHDAHEHAPAGGIDWRFTVGDRVKIRLVNEMDSDHPMHHPFHLHGAGRFLILSRDGVPEPNLVWKDTVLV